MEQNIEHTAEQDHVAVRTDLLTKTKSKPLGELMTSALTCGIVGAVLTIILALIGWYDGLDQSLKEFYMSDPLYMSEPSWTIWYSVCDMVMVILLTFGVSFAVLDTDKKWRRVMMIIMLTVVVMITSPALMLWDVFWSPVTVLVGLLWSSTCAFIYSCQHTMPCELWTTEQFNQKDKVELNLPEPIELEESSEKTYQPKNDHYV